MDLQRPAKARIAWSVFSVAVVLIAVAFALSMLPGCGWFLPSIPKPPMDLPRLPDPMLAHAHAGVVGSIPAVTVTLTTLVWLIRVLFLLAAASAVCSGLVGSVPVLGRLGAPALIRAAAYCAGSGVACLMVSIILTRSINFVDRHPTAVGLVFFGSLLSAAGAWAYGHRYAIERWTNIDLTGDKKIGDPAV